MKIIHVRTHENVVLDGNLENNFMAINRNRRPSTKMQLIKELNCIEISSEKDSVLVPMVNIAFIKVESPYSLEKEAAAKAEAAKPKSNPKLNTVKKPR